MKASVHRTSAVGIVAMVVAIVSLVLMPHAAYAAMYTPPASNRVDHDLSSAWKFHKGDVSGAPNISIDDSSWLSLDLPHTWNGLDGQDGGSNYYRGIGWYRKHYTVPSTQRAENVSPVRWREHRRRRMGQRDLPGAAQRRLRAVPFRRDGCDQDRHRESDRGESQQRP